MSVSFEGKKILLIDDDITALDIIAYLFEGEGFQVGRKTDGNRALEAVLENPPDLIIVDLMMPGINGVETVKGIRKAGFETLPIIAFTSVDEHSLHQEASNAGCNLVITKPCHPDRLLQYVRSLLT